MPNVPSPITMTTTKVCVTSVFPSFDSLYLTVKKLKFPDLKNLIPVLPTPLLPQIKFPSFDLVSLTMGLIVEQFLKMLEAIVKPFIKFMGLVFEFPTFLGIKFQDLLLGKIPWPKLKISINIPDFYAMIKNKAMQLFQAFMAALTEYLMSCIKKVVDLIKKFIDFVKKAPWKLSLPGLPELPELPTLAQLKTYIKGLWDGFIDKLKIKFPFIEKIKALIEKIKQLKLLDLSKLRNLFDKVKFPEISLNFQISITMMALASMWFKMIYDWCIEKVQSLLKFEFPKVCVDIPTPTGNTPNVPIADNSVPGVVTPDVPDQSGTLPAGTL